jgi:WD40 repeat protein
MADQLASRSLAHFLQRSGHFSPVMVARLLQELLVHYTSHRLAQTDRPHDRSWGWLTPECLMAIEGLGGDLELLTPNCLDVADPEFSAPECLDAAPTEQGLVYNIGLIAVYLLTGLRPFDLFDVANNCWVWRQYWQLLAENKDSADVEFLSLADILDGAIHLSPSQRFASLADMLNALHKLPRSFQLQRQSPTKTTWYCTQNLVGHTGLFAAVNAISLHPQRSIAATASDDCTIRVWDLHTGETLAVLRGHDRFVTALCFHALAPQLLFSGGRDGCLKLWNWEAQQEIQSVIGHVGGVQAIAVSPTDGLLATAGADRTLKLWQWELLTLVQTKQPHRLAVNALAIAPGGRKMASASSDRQVWLWDVDSPAPVLKIAAHTAAVRAVAFHPTGELVASAGDDGSIHMYTVATGELRNTLSGHSWPIAALEFLADGDRLVSASWDQTIKIWQVDGWLPLETLSGHQDSVTCLAVSGDGRTIGSGSKDATAKIWHC